MAFAVEVAGARPEGLRSLPAPKNLERRVEALDLRLRPRELGVARPSLGLMERAVQVDVAISLV